MISTIIKNYKLLVIATATTQGKTTKQIDKLVCELKQFIIDHDEASRVYQRTAERANEREKNPPGPNLTASRKKHQEPDHGISLSTKHLQQSSKPYQKGGCGQNHQLLPRRRPWSGEDGHARHQDHGGTQEFRIQEKLHPCLVERGTRHQINPP